MHKLFTFLGTGSYEAVNYQFGEKSECTAHFPIPLAEWIEADKTYYFLTSEAKKHNNWTRVVRKLDDLETRYEAVDIPDGATEEELWTIFAELTKHADPGDKISIDITHGYRSLPLLGFIAAVFLRQARGFDIHGLYYGAYEARDPKTKSAPVFELSPFLDLLKWLSATEKFIDTGNSGSLGDLLGAIQNDAMRAGSPNAPRTLRPLAKVLSILSSELLLGRPLQAGESAADVTRKISEARPDLNSAATLPFATLLEKVEDAYLPRADSSLAGQIELIQWYIDHGHILQAATVGREWIVTFLCEQLSLDPLSGRDDAETALNHLVLSHLEGGVEGTPSPHLEQTRSLPCAEKLSQYWSRARDLRNDLAHCGYRTQPLNVCKLSLKTRKLLEDIKALHSSV